jgi:hypothetical protein
LILKGPRAPFGTAGGLATRFVPFFGVGTLMATGFTFSAIISCLAGLGLADTGGRTGGGAPCLLTGGAMAGGPPYLLMEAGGLTGGTFGVACEGAGFS